MKTVYCFGDCHTSGSTIPIKENPTPDDGYVKFLRKKLNSKKYNVINMGRTNITIEAVIDHPNLFLPTDAEQGDIACIWLGSNDIFLGRSTEILIDNFDKFCKSLTDLQLEIIVFTLLPRTYFDRVNTEYYSANRKIFNEHIQKNYKRVIDPTRNGKMGVNEIRRIYRSSVDHFNEKGYKAVAKLVYDKIKEIGL